MIGIDQQRHGRVRHLIAQGPGLGQVIDGVAFLAVEVLDDQQQVVIGARIPSHPGELLQMLVGGLLVDPFGPLTRAPAAEDQAHDAQALGPLDDALQVGFKTGKIAFRTRRSGRAWPAPGNWRLRWAKALRLDQER